MPVVELPAVSLLLQSLISKLRHVTNSARTATIEEDIFGQFASYLERILSVCVELQEYRDTTPMMREIVEALIRDIERADVLIKSCSNKSRIYLVTHYKLVSQQLVGVIHDLGRSLSLIPVSSVQVSEDMKAVIESLSRELQHSHFEIKHADERICELLNEDSIYLQNDPDLQAGLLLDIARSVGIDGTSSSALKLQVELLKNDLQGTTEAYDLQMMNMLGQMVDNWAQNADSITSVEESSNHYREKKRIEPLYEAFICPLTKKVMTDPVTLENGQTYERSAIERWFQDCRDNKRRPVCPTTGKLLESITLKPSIALRHTIEEWTTRNETLRLENAKSVLASRSSDQDMLSAFLDIQVLCQKNSMNKHKSRNVGLIPLITDCLKENEHVRLSALATLRVLAEGVDDNKEAIGETDAIRRCIKCLSRDGSKEKEEASLLLYELSKFQPMCEKIGLETGAILVLVGTVSSSADNPVTVRIAEQTLDNLEICDQNVRQMAENGRLKPLLSRLQEGGEEIRLEMATMLGELVLSREGKAKAAELGGKTLVEMLESGYMAGRESALKCLCHLSSLESNAKLLVESGILQALIRSLFAVGVNQLPMKLKEISATTLANIVNSGTDLEKIRLDRDGNTITSETVLHNLLHLISNTGPAIEAKLLRVLVGLASSPNAVSKIVKAIRSAGATVSLIQFLEAPQKELQASSVKLLYHLCPHMGQDLVHGLHVATGQLGTLVRMLEFSGITEEQAAAAKLIANLPIEDTNLTRVLLREGALSAVLKQLNDLSQGVIQVGGRRFVNDFKEGLVGILYRCTYLLHDDNMLALAQAHNLTSLFTKLLSPDGIDEVRCLSALAMANMSLYSRALSTEPEPVILRPGLLACLRPSMPKKVVGLCKVHGGVCSAKLTFCLHEAGAVVPLVVCLEHQNMRVVESALKALSTLLMDGQNNGNIEGGIQVLNNAGAIQPILDIMREHRTDNAQQQSVSIVECILRDDDMARTILRDANVHTALVEAFRYGNNQTKQMAEKALKHLNKIPSFSGVFAR